MIFVTGARCRRLASTKAGPLDRVAVSMGRLEYKFLLNVIDEAPV